MNALELLREQAATAEQGMRAVLGLVAAEQAHWRGEGSTANTVASALYHVYLSEDRAAGPLLGATTTRLEAGGWPAKIGVSPDEVWSAEGRPDFAALRGYAEEVAAETQRLLGQLDPAALEREMDTPRGKRTVGSRLGLLLVIHKASHMGEIGAVLGAQGAKGFPF